MRHPLTLAALTTLCACGISPNREVQGTLTGMSTQQALVFSETTDGQVAVASVSPRNGSFVVEVPTNRPTRLVIAHDNGAGVAIADRHIGPAWFTVAQGGRLDLGVVRPAGTERGVLASVSGAVHQCPGSSSSTGKKSQSLESDGDDKSGDKSDGKDGSKCDAKDGGDDVDTEVEDGDCGSVEVEGCGEAESDCDHDDALTPVGGANACGGGATTPAPGGTGGAGGGTAAPIN